MIVNCSTCSARFNVPDVKVSGRRARMKCKKCGAPIIIDGTHLERGPSSASHAPPSSPTGSQPRHGSQPHHAAPSKEPSAPFIRDIAPRWRVQLPNGERVEMSLDEAAVLRREQRLPEGTLICAPGKSQWLAPDQFNELERRAGFPVAAPRPPLPTFTDVTVAFGAAETEVLKFQSRSPAHHPPTSGGPSRAKSGEFFNAGDVDQAMASFDHITGSSEDRSEPGLRAAPARPSSSSFPPLPGLGSTLPPPINAPPPPVGDGPAPARRPQTIPSFPPPPPAPSSYPPPPMGQFAMAASAHGSWPPAPAPSMNAAAFS
ncbi:MAG TPA: zinc-ribbon domain-containing protein, partial [Polyangiaceae bacterium]|nr:zinc-ribbon domain-containing protein [Polyangiaceae bacterium]